MYVELHCHSCFSLLDGASPPEALVARAAELDMPALALTDHDALYGAVSFWRAATDAGIKPIFGAEMTMQGGFHLTVLAETPAGYANLGRLITAARMRCAKGRAEASWSDLAQHSNGLIALSGCRQGEVASHLRAGNSDAARQAARRLREMFGPGRLYVELQRQLLPGDERLVQGLIALAAGERLPLVASNNVHYATRAGHRLHDVLAAIRHLATLDESHHQRRGNSEAHLKPAAELSRLFADRPDALASTLEIAARCNVSLRRGMQDLPLFPVPAAIAGLQAADSPPGHPEAATSPQRAYLRWLCEVALVQRYGGEPGARARQLLAHELAVIGRLELDNYFLVVWDIVRFARAQGIRCQGRGSAANSLVAYLLSITPIDPLAHDLVFERFLSDERASLPDIDIDFDALRREEVIQYVYQRYGHDHAAMACNLVTFRARSAVRDVGRALGFPQELVDALARSADLRGLEEGWREWERSLVRGEPAAAAAAGGQPSRVDSRSWQLLLQLCQEIHGLPRHLGIHNGGMVLSRPPLAEIVPLEPARMEKRTVCQWDKEALEDAGLVKVDLLGLRMLSALEEALAVVEETTGQRPDLDHLTFDDPSVYDMLCRGETIGCFQVESRAQSQLVPRFRPRCFNDLVIEISLIRPGPIQGNMVQPYLRRRQGKEPVSYLHPRLQPALAETLGVIVFQEQVVKIARDLAGWTAGEGELLRRAMGRKHGAAEMARLRGAFVAGAAAQGVPVDVAEAVFQQLTAFGGYAFAKSHAAAFAVIVYQSAWLKRYHPLAFTIGLLRCQPMGFYSPAVLVNDAKRRGIPALAVDVNRSGATYQAEGNAIRIGLGAVKGMGEQGARRVLAARADTPFASLADFCRRTRLPRLLVESLIAAGALDSLTSSSQAATRRRELLWQLGLLDYAEESLLEDDPDPAPDELPPLDPLEALTWELKTVGVSAGEHVMAHHRAELARRGVLSSRDLPRCHGGQVIWVAGQVTVIQSPPTAKGFWFITLEDEFGMMNLIVAPDVAAAHRRVWRHSPLLAAQVRVQREGSVVNLLAIRPQLWRG